jgi:hypothetical protein
MEPWGHVALTTTDLPDELQFRVVRHPGWVYLLFGFVPYLIPAAFIVLPLATRQHGKEAVPPLFLGIFLLAIICVWTARSLRRSTESLVVNPSGITVAGEHVKFTVTASELTKPGYGLEGGRQYGLYGDRKYGDFYLKRGRTSIPILSGLSEEQQKVVSDLVYRRFPEVCAGANGAASLLFGDKTGITSLGLYKTDQTGDRS